MKITGIKKVILSMSVETGDGIPERKSLAEPISFEFVYGIGPSGLTPLELELADKEIGDELRVHVSRDAMGEFFSHTLPTVSSLSEESGEIYVNIRVADVREAEQREVIRAIAETANCGDHCCGH